MGLVRDLALFNLAFPDKVSPEMKSALYGRWVHDMTTTKKDSLGTKVVKSVTNPVKNLVQSSINVVKYTAKGDIGKAVGNSANVATLGTADFTGNNRGILNISSTKYLKALTGGGVRATASTSMLPDTTDTTTTKKKTGLLTQLRQARGSAGGGSYTEAVKNPLGGSAGKTGR